MQVHWFKCKSGYWCAFEIFNLDSVTEHGVYVIGYKKPEGDYIYTVYVGQGDVAARLADHRSDSDITSYRSRGTLYTTWAEVSVHNRDGVERYVAGKLKPLVGSRHPDVTPIPVNLPADWV